MGRTDELARRFEDDSNRLAELEVRQRMAGRWMWSSIQTTFTIMPALTYWFGGVAFGHPDPKVWVPTLVAFTTLQTRLFFPVGSLLSVQIDLQTSLALFDRIFEYLDEPVDIQERPGALAEAPAGDVVFDHVSFGYGDTRTLEDVTFTVPAGTTTAIVGETGAGKTTLAYLVARLYDVQSGSVSVGGVDVRDMTFEALTVSSGSCRRRRTSSTPPCATTFGSHDPTRPTRRSRTLLGPHGSTTSWRVSRTATTPSSGSAAIASPGARSSGSPSRARSCATPRCSSSTRRQLPRQRGRSGRCRRRSTGRRGEDDDRHRAPAFHRP